MTTLTYSEQLTVLHCAACSISFAMPDDFESRRRKDHVSFYCPAGHSNMFNGESEEQKLRKQLEREQAAKARLTANLDQARADADHERARANGYKGQATKMKNRIGKGVCPCCNRQFTNVERHMATQHPDFAGATS